MANQGKVGLCQMMNTLISVAFFAAGAFVLWIYLGQPSAEDLGDALGNVNISSIGDIDFGDFSDVLGNITGDYGELWDMDPFLSDNSTSSWRSNGEGGLELEMLNALDDTWQTEYTEALADWENGDPDTLTLPTKKVEVDHGCRPVDGVMKVCNGNYGPTGWLGVNELTQSSATKIIQSSVAKMNEYYLLNADIYERQYTMCHEIGHGFGLPHTDENFNNADLGNCLDYTRKPRNNLHPDASNYNRLKGLYGVVGNRRLGAPKSAGTKQVENSIFTAELHVAYEKAIIELQELLSSEKPDEPQGNGRWRLLRQHSKGSDYVRKLNEEYELEVHLLHTLTNNDNE